MRPEINHGFMPFSRGAPPQKRPLYWPFHPEGSMCSHYQTLKDAELLLNKFGVREKPAAIGKYDM